VILRDIKLENIVFEKKDLESTLKIIDFGRSKILHPRESFTEKAGSVTLYITYRTFTSLLKSSSIKNIMRSVIYGVVVLFFT